MGGGDGSSWVVKVDHHGWWRWIIMGGENGLSWVVKMDHHGWWRWISMDGGSSGVVETDQHGKCDQGWICGK